ncbi:hypothetical protein AAHA92_07243 [Salvia divinorum]|uniref:Uncharacterized protein n=1 Tax=Salvia divinorum TaxID=28513 RepID=A0ABD1I8F1_SALDI
MAETSARFLARNVSQLLEFHSELIIGAENELRWLIMDIDMLTAQAAEMNPNNDVDPLEKGVKELIYELEDAIDSFLTDAVASGNVNLSLQHAGQGHIIAEKVKNFRLRHLKELIDAYMSMARIRSVEERPKTVNHIIVEKVKDLRLRHLMKLTDAYISKPRISSVDQRQTIVKTLRPVTGDRVLVALEDEEDTMIGYLTKSKEELDVISIIGMRGLGKTTLARRIYENERIAYEYPTRIWIHVSRNSKSRDVYLNILKTFSSVDMSGTMDQEIIETVRACLEDEKFLLILDDLRSHDDWKGIESILPHNNGRSKVLITSCDNYVDAGVIGKPSDKVLRFLTSDESWKLLQLEVFGNLKDCPPELEEIGQQIADKCGGLPLQMVVVGGILAGQIMEPRGVGAIKSEWQKVFENEKLFLHNKRSIYDAAELIYSGLPNDLRECFLYMGVFPEGYEISAWTLTRLWIAEGFVRAKGNQNLEESANQNLYNLISRNLVVVDKINSVGEVKTCSVRDMIRAFCLDKALEQNLFQEIKGAQKRDFKMKEGRRLCVHSNVEALLSEVPNIPSVRSFLFYMAFPYLDPRYISSILDACNLLRVLDSKSIRLDEFPTRITKLLHLRYITLCVDDLQNLPQFLSELWNLQTLVVDTTSHTIKVEANIWRLRHVMTNAAIILSPVGISKAGENLQTLTILSPESCTEDVSEAAHNLKTLRIRGKLLTMFENSFLENLVCLEKLKLVNGDSLEMAYQNPLQGLPEPNCFPPCLKWLTLSNTFLKWNHLSTLARIETLEVLKLKDNACTGMYWNVEEDGFPSLQFLLIATADLVIWEASVDSLPSLRRLVLKNCRNLNEFPVALKSLEILEIGRVNISIVTYARNIAEEKASSKIPFKLSIAP